MHKRKANKLQERKIRGIIQRGSYYDRCKGEVVSKVTRLDIISQLKEPIEIHVIPDLEKGEVLLDSRGKGSLQR
jgi:hypothetical protein